MKYPKYTYQKDTEVLHL